MKYFFIEAEKVNFPVYLMCRVLGVSQSGYYRWRKRRGQPDRRILSNEAELRAAIRRLHRKSRGRYGRPRLLEDLRAMGFRVGGNRVRRIMLEMGLRGRSGPKRTRRRSKVSQSEPAPNLLARSFDVALPNRVWAGDLTQAQVGPRRAWLAAIVDLHSRRTVGCAVGKSATASLVTSAMKEAVRRRRPPRGLIFHSDQGSQYTSERFRAQLRVLGIRQSMSRRGNCWDNAPVESFFATLKKELVYTRAWASIAEFERALKQYIHFYNCERRHSTLGYLTPNDYENLPKAA